jgi:hypothetical protein
MSPEQRIGHHDGRFHTVLAHSLCMFSANTDSNESYALFADAVVLVNMWGHDVGRADDAGTALFRSIYRYALQQCQLC